MAAEENQKKPSALERRMSVAKAELLQSLPHHKDKRDAQSAASSSGDPPPQPTDASASSPFARKSSAFRGHVNLTGYVSIPESEANGPVYYKLSHPVNENLMSINDKICSEKESTIEDTLAEFFAKGDFALKFSHGSKKGTIDNKILLDNVVQGRNSVSGVPMRVLQKQSKRSRKHISVKQHKRMGSFNLPQELHRYDNFKPMNDMWKDYMAELLRNTNNKVLLQDLLDADLHGAVVHVVHSKVSSFTGVSGIMIRETAETFGIITEDNKFRVVPKKASVFVFQIDCWKVTLRGDKLSVRNLVSN